MPEDTDAGAAFRSLLDQLGELGDIIDREATDDVERAEGYRHLTRLLSASSEWLLEKADTDRPAFTRVMTPWRKFIGDNPDTYYDVAPVAAGATYRLTGARNDAHYLGVTVYGRGADGGIGVLGQASDSDFVSTDGRIDLTVGGDESDATGGWVPLAAGAESLWVRQYFYGIGTDRDADLHIERIDVPVGRPHPVSDEQVAAGLDRMAAFADATLDAVTTVSRMMAGSPNTPLMAGAEFSVEDQDEAGSASGSAEATNDAVDTLEDLLLKLARASYPTPDNQYAGVWFDLDPDEALLVTGVPPANARYWGVQLANRWQESLDYVHHEVCLNDRQIDLESDGSYRIVVSATNPGVANWLDTSGHRGGMVNVRALLADSIDQPFYEVVLLDSLKA